MNDKQLYFANWRGPFRPLLDRLRRHNWPAAAGRAAASRRAGVFVLSAFFLAASLWTAYICSRYVDYAHSDESHTIYYGYKHLNPFGAPSNNFKVGETTRWFARLLYPAGLYYMDSHLGGGAREKHANKYLDQHLKGWGEYPRGFKKNPGIQDYVFAMRIAFAMLAIGSFCLALWGLHRRVNLAAAAAYGAFILGSEAQRYAGHMDGYGPLVLGQFLRFYTETTMFILFNLAAFLCLERNMSYRKVAYLAILAAAAMSAKLSGVIIAAPLFAYVAFDMRQSPRPLQLRMEVFILFFAASMLLINVNVSSVREFLNDTLWNLFHYKSGGHSDIAGAGGLDFFRLMVRDMGYPILLSFPLAFLWLLKSPRVALVPVYVLGAVVVFTLWSMLDAAGYVDRNVAAPYVAMSFIVALAAGDLAGKTLVRRPGLQAGATLGLLLVFIIAAGALLSDIKPLGNVFLDKNRARIQSCRTIAAIGLADDDLRALRSRTRGDVAAFPPVRGPFKFKQKEVPNYISKRLRLDGVEVPELAEKFRAFQRHDCLVAHRREQTKQVTNFLAPLYYTSWGRTGNFFLFVRDKNKKLMQSNRGRIKLPPQAKR